MSETPHWTFVHAESSSFQLKNEAEVDILEKTKAVLTAAQP